MDLDDTVLQEVAERIIAKLEERIAPLGQALEDLANLNDSILEENGLLLERLETLEEMLGLREPDCSCEECAKPPAFN